MNKLERYMAWMMEAQEAAEVINEWLAGHGDVDPESVTWADVGDAARIAEQLAEIAEILASRK